MDKPLREPDRCFVGCKECGGMFNIKAVAQCPKCHPKAPGESPAPTPNPGEGSNPKFLVMDLWTAEEIYQAVVVNALRLPPDRLKRLLSRLNPSPTPEALDLHDTADSLIRAMVGFLAVESELEGLSKSKRIWLWQARDYAKRRGWPHGSFHDAPLVEIKAENPLHEGAAPASPTPGAQEGVSPWSKERPCPWCKSCGLPAKYHREEWYATGSDGNLCKTFVPWDYPATPDPLKGAGEGKEEPNV